MSPLSIFESEFSQENYRTFLEQWIHEIEEIFPHFNEEDIHNANVYILEYGGINAGLFIYLQKGDELHVEVDYLIPEFRDLGVGQLFFKRKIEEFSDRGYKTIISLTNDDEHRKYLLDVGFKLSSSHPDRYIMELV